ncbi:MAG: hypothetical protein EPN21_02135 [Methylococcaceae bacterium]|nr:MAG: hypothetical protein EPN21_02135 [Methylococcaceae bacterium]
MKQGGSVPVSKYADVLNVRQLARDLARELGFDDCGQEEVCIVVSELSTNLIKHAVQGIVSIKPFIQDGQAGLAIISDDNGPGFDFAGVLADGISTTRTLGCGLGAIQRLTDDLEYHAKQPQGAGSYILCKKLLKSGAHRQHQRPSPLDFGVVTQPKNGQTVNGDLYLVKHDAHATLLAVIDGVGHGLLANKAAQAAKQYVEAHSGLPLRDLFLGADRACHATNGVVMALAAIDLHHRRLTFASVGNIEAKVVNHHEKFDLIVRRGIVGRNSPAPYISEGHWTPGCGLVLHSDGLSSRWKWEDYSHHFGRPAQTIAEMMFHELHKNNDDATLMFVKQAEHGR